MMLMHRTHTALLLKATTTHTAASTKEILTNDLKLNVELFRYNTLALRGSYTRMKRERWGGDGG